MFVSPQNPKIRAIAMALPVDIPALPYSSAVAPELTIKA
jgi:hypothetical protein